MICSSKEEHCDRIVTSTNLCSMHYQREWWKKKHGHYQSRRLELVKVPKEKSCHRQGCNNPPDTTTSRTCVYHRIHPINESKDFPGWVRGTKGKERYIRLTNLEDGRQKLEHRALMAMWIGRELLPNENVHHKNGKRDDNRRENLELWTTKQPTGQRPEDLVAYAKEILAIYG